MINLPWPNLNNLFRAPRGQCFDRMDILLQNIVLPTEKWGGIPYIIQICTKKINWAGGQIQLYKSRNLPELFTEERRECYGLIQHCEERPALRQCKRIPLRWSDAFLTNVTKTRISTATTECRLKLYSAWFFRLHINVRTYGQQYMYTHTAAHLYCTCTSLGHELLQKIWYWCCTCSVCIRTIHECTQSTGKS